VDEASARSTYLEILQQTVSGVVRRLGAAIRKPVEAGSGKELAAAPLLASAATVTLSCGEAEVTILVHAPGMQASASSAEQSSAASPAATAGPAAAPPKNMDALLDVELPVSISFGKAQLPLRDVLKLSGGSVVELNRTPDELVEIVVNNCVIARGEVVTIDGNYGVRVHEIISRQQRLALHEETKGLVR
jgi:flagellar motor switch protein FliN/FliY